MAGVRHARGVELAKKKIFFRNAVTKTHDAPYLVLDEHSNPGAPTSAKPPRSDWHPKLRSPCGSVIDRSSRLAAFCRLCHQTIIEEIVMKLDSRSGATLAAAAATLFLAGAVISTTSAPASAAQGKCMGANACKGQSACKGAANSCKGLNACKTNGFTMASEAKCTSMGGKFVKG
jgi:hypothetical protein